IWPNVRLSQAIDEREPRDRNEPLPLVGDHARHRPLFPVTIQAMGLRLRFISRPPADPFIRKLNVACVGWRGRHEEPLPLMLESLPAAVLVLDERRAGKKPSPYYA